MNATVESLYNAALALPIEAREELAERLFASLDDEPDVGPTPEQEAEIEKRLAEVRSGKAKLIPADEVFESVLKAIRERKSP